MLGLIHPIILCGGSGTRLWPVSRQSFPKQFSVFAGNESLFQSTIKRFGSQAFARPIIISNADFRFIVTQQMAQVERDPATILIEPSARNTAPAALVAALWLERRESGALMLLCPSDHLIPDTAAFQRAIENASDAARAGQIITFGIKPDRPETGYGWLALGDEAGAGDMRGPCPLAAFVEKPEYDKARSMLEDGRFLWNAGIFLCSTTTMISAFETHQPQMVERVKASLDKAQDDLSFCKLDAAEWNQLENISVDYAIMEKAHNLSVMPYAGGWSDLGSWESVWQESGPDNQGVVTSAGATAIGCENSLLRVDGDSIELVGIGLKDIVAIAMPDAVLIAHKNHTQDVKHAVTALKGRGAVQAEHYPKVHRPWGWFESLVFGGRFQVKRIVVHPSAALSLQSHHHRAEHWVVVEGTALVMIGNEEKLVSENQSVYIPLGVKHRLTNPGKVPLTLIEVQTGSYLGEDDIIRYEDMYAREAEPV